LGDAVRVLAIVAIAALLAGCTDADWAHVMSYVPTGPTAHEEPEGPSPVPSATATTAPTAVSPTAVSPTAVSPTAVSPTAVSPTVTANAGDESPTVNAAAATGVSERAQRECIQWADERAEDATNQNFDADTALKVRDATYANCMTWAVRLHR
jgi:hypothetical protein